MCARDLFFSIHNQELVKKLSYPIFGMCTKFCAVIQEENYYTVMI